MGRVGRRTIAATLAALALLASWAAPRLSAQLNERHSGPPRVLLLGDSVMDQQGSAAALLLRENGIDAFAHGAWGTGLLTREQYDFGHTILAPPRSPDDWDWLTKGREYVDTMRPDLVVVYLDHNYWPPLPRDAAGHEITDLRTPAGQQMIATQARAFIHILRRHGARVAFVTPVPMTKADPAADNAIWPAYLPVLREEHASIIDIRPALAGANGTRIEAKPDCTGAPTLVRPPGDIHLTRYGAGRSATRLAAAIAALLGRDLHGDARARRPHDDARSDRDRPGLLDRELRRRGIRLRRRPAHHERRAPGRQRGDRRDARAQRAVARDERRADPRRGGAPALQFSTAAGAPLVAATGIAGGHGVLATTAGGEVIAAGRAIAAGGAERLGSPVVAVVADPAGRGYWLVSKQGTVVARGGASALGSSTASTSPVVGMTASATGHGYLLVRADGHVLAFGDARAAGDAAHPPLKPGTLAVLAPTQPSVAIVRGARAAATGSSTTTERCTRFGGAARLGGTGNLALFTP